MRWSTDGPETPAVRDGLPTTLLLYRFLMTAAAPLAPLLLSYRLNRGKEDPARLGERRGEAGVPRPAGPLVWVHGASVGEITAVLPLINRICAEGFAVLVTSGTTTSAELAQQRLPAGAIHQFVPLDVPTFVGRFFDHWQPDLALFVESDLWPNLVVASAERKIPLVLLNGRVSQRSFARWSRIPQTISAVLRRFDLCLAQSPADAERYGRLGAQRVVMTGNLKLDVPAPTADPAEVEAMRVAISGRPVLAAASTHAGEEAAVMDAHQRLRPRFSNLLTILVPRHPHRGAEIEELARSSSLTPALRSRGQLPDAGTEIYVADTMGELGLIYRIASVVFMGGSLVEHGGQNPIEPIKLGAAIVHGPHVWNFADIYSALDGAGGAEQVKDATMLAACIGGWLADDQQRQAVTGAARRTVDRLGGALDRTLQALEPYFMQLRLGRHSRDA
ncbi:MAG: 3-deoxy-D-manno-octulosonic-acid transferase [Alphaproteobacteria bacterium]|jgi:3-deoxy-D-manno-octulosonic-acid transferase|nr:3-deoxy-D-manno-octulosonic-acid transferase [Alphaproteobacteria bacterium]